MKNAATACAHSGFFFLSRPTQHTSPKNKTSPHKQCTPPRLSPGRPPPRPASPARAWVSWKRDGRGVGWAARRCTPTARSASPAGLSSHGLSPPPPPPTPPPSHTHSPPPLGRPPGLHPHRPRVGRGQGREEERERGSGPDERREGEQARISSSRWECLLGRLRPTGLGATPSHHTRSRGAGMFPKLLVRCGGCYPPPPLRSHRRAREGEVRGHAPSYGQRPRAALPFARARAHPRPPQTAPPFHPGRTLARLA